MKTINQFLLLIIFLTSLLHVYSCDNTDNDNNSDNIQKYFGEWIVNDQNARINYKVVITANPSNSAEVLIHNFANLNSTAVALIIDNYFVVDLQSLGDSYYVSGNGNYIDSGKMVMNFELNNGIDNEKELLPLQDSVHFITMKQLTIIISLLLAVLLVSCKKDPVQIPTIQNYLHISHTRTASNPGMDSVAEQIDYHKYNMLWLGGDMAANSSGSDFTMSHLSSILNFSNKNTLWALGNHDYDDLDLIQNYTNRPAYYVYNHNNITFIILDTQDSLSNIVGEQLAMVKSVFDTISESSHLILLHHKLIWMYNNPDLEPQIPGISNGIQGDCFYCINPNNFYDDIYPELVDVKSRGINIICIGGDIGFNASEFEYITTDGIYFLASGIDYNNPDKKALLFQHNLETKTLSWEYKQLITL